MNPRLTQIQESATIRIADKARELERQGVSVIKLQTGDPNFCTRGIISESAFDAMKAGYTHYGPSRGLPELRQAVAVKLKQENGIAVDPNTEVLITHGAAHALFASFQAILEPGDEVILLEPYYMSYASSIRIAGGVPVTIPSSPENGFRVDIDRVASAVTRHTKAIVVNSPCNPTGVVLGKGELNSLCDLAINNNLIVISDEVYERLLFDGHEHISVASFPGMAERTISINSFSKTYAMTGWRIGYLAAPKAIVREILKIIQYSVTNIAPFIQIAALTALTTPALDSDIHLMRCEYEKRRNAAVKTVEQFNNLGFLMPQGAFYLMIDITSSGLDSLQFASDLIDHARVAVVPGSAFGASAEGWLRLTFSVPEKEIIEGIEHIGSMLKTCCAKRKACS